MEINSLIKEMTLEEKAGMCSGADFWHTKSVERLGLPSVIVSDGPHGIRKHNEEIENLAANESIVAVCFPTACATASSFDRELLQTLGEVLGDTCQAVGVATLLGPATNIKRSPLCGRNFEYFSEDPFLASQLSKSHILGVQSRNIGSSIKHFLANNQEYRRMTCSSNVDERTLREIYLAAFESAVKEAKPYTVMCSYNRINGTFVSESKKYLTDILRDEWGFDGVVISDWGAANNRVEGLRAGMDLEMPGSYGVNDKKIVEAIKNGDLDEEILDNTVRRILTLVKGFLDNRKPDTSWDKEAHHELSRSMEEECAVLLKNEGILPLDERKKIAFIGCYADEPRFQGGGSSHINCHKKESAMEYAPDSVTFARGFQDGTDDMDEMLIGEAVELAKKSDVAVIFAGLPDSFESEGYDREHMSMPKCQNYLIEEVAKVQPNVVVVLHNGSPIEMPWIDKVKGVLEVYLGGQAVGGATVNLLYGRANPCGKLAETFPLKLEDNPSYLFFKGEKDEVDYREGIFVGYRYYDKKKMDVLFPFGHGLSYTSFEYSNLRMDRDTMKDTEEVLVSVDITNTGKCFGKEIVQLYVADKESTVIRPVRELKEFKKVALEPGQTKTIMFTLGKRAFAYYNTEISDWHVETGEFEVQIGKSSRDIILRAVVRVQSTVRIPIVYDENSTFGEIMENPRRKAIVQPLIDAYVDLAPCAEDGTQTAASEAISKEMQERTFCEAPLRNVLGFGDGTVSAEMIAQIVDQLNECKD